MIVGEKHDNPGHHQPEQWLMVKLQALRPQGSLLLEMLTPDQQIKVSQVKAWLQKAPVVRDSQIQAFLQWDPDWPWPLYRQVVMTALRAPYPILAANLAQSEVTELKKQPVFPKGVFPQLPKSSS